MKQHDIMSLMDAITPSIAASFLKATESLVQRVKKLEEELKDANDRITLLSDITLIEERVGVTEAQIKGLSDRWITPKDVEEIASEHVVKAFALLPQPKDGKDVDPEWIKMLIDEAVEKLPPAEPGKDADPIVMKQMVDEAVFALEVALKGSVHTMFGELKTTAECVTADYQQALADYQQALVDLSKLPKAKDGESVTIEQLAPMVAEQVNLKVAALPRAKDGVGLAGGMIDREGNLILTMTDGTVRDVGNVLGKDGMGFDNLDVIDNSDEFVLRMKSGDHLKVWTLRKPTIADFYKGVWSPGMHARGTLVTWGGSLWMAQCDTEIKPDTKDNDDWKLVVKRGRDAKDFTPVSSK